MSTSALTLPDSELAVAAYEFATAVSPPFVLNHVVRSYLFARELAAAKGLRAGVDYDDELVYLSCVLHDLGLTDHADGDQRFEVDGADAAAEFLRRHEVDEQRITTVWQAIALHTSVGLAHRFGPVIAVAHLGISADVVGVDRELLDPTFTAEVNSHWPRLGLGAALAETIADQVERNPQKGPPLTFPRQLHHLVTASAAPSFFDLVAASGWDDGTPS
ncbi:HD domain-containing protein [Mycolicibacterium sp. 018/SC-01/001]|uniref:HD domain-containing protein n=1 Tax=Mycolicibacterium sp. 018/SC-01/001 TaxID=2592069 RepID=UPI00117BE7C0|nr:HD domain-containing protein [Mycolicibacterium sp. 018/SC-01/001]TRW80025.1 HD domain-containing protein [Mycolicibacterium sp. 018/SC-01/001]